MSGAPKLPELFVPASGCGCGLAYYCVCDAAPPAKGEAKATRSAAASSSGSTPEEPGATQEAVHQSKLKLERAFRKVEKVVRIAKMAEDEQETRFP